jgi:hypothetical protein
MDLANSIAIHPDRRRNILTITLISGTAITIMAMRMHTQR